MRFIFIAAALSALFLCAQPVSAEPTSAQPPSTEEYNNVPPGIMMSDGAPATDQAPAPASDEKDVMTMSDIIAAYKRGEYDLVLKHVLPIARGKYPMAQELLGIMYRNGQGVPKDPEQALYWLTEAAEGGRPVAQHHLAVMAFAGEGGPADPVKALMWLHIAISQYTDGLEKERAEQDLSNVSGRLSRRDRDRAYSLARDWLDRQEKPGFLRSQDSR